MVGPKERCYRAKSGLPLSSMAGMGTFVIAGDAVLEIYAGFPVLQTVNQRWALPLGGVAWPACC